MLGATDGTVAASTTCPSSALRSPIACMRLREIPRLLLKVRQHHLRLEVPLHLWCLMFSATTVMSTIANIFTGMQMVLQGRSEAQKGHNAMYGAARHGVSLAVFMAAALSDSTCGTSPLLLDACSSQKDHHHATCTFAVSPQGVCPARC